MVDVNLQDLLSIHVAGLQGRVSSGLTLDVAPLCSGPVHHLWARAAFHDSDSQARVGFALSSSQVRAAALETN